MKPTVKPEEANILLKIPVIKDKGDALSQLLFHFALDYTVTKFQINQMGLKFKWKL
jgi:hypothetical protein